MKLLTAVRFSFFAESTPANEHDVTAMSEFLNGKEECAYCDSGYIRADKRPEAVRKKDEGKITLHSPGTHGII